MDELIDRQIDEWIEGKRSIREGKGEKINNNYKSFKSIDVLN